MEKDILRIRVYDKNNLLADKELGVAMVPVAAVKGAEELDFSLRGGCRHLPKLIGTRTGGGDPL